MDGPKSAKKVNESETIKTLGDHKTETISDKAMENTKEMTNLTKICGNLPAKL